MARLPTRARARERESNDSIDLPVIKGSLDNRYVVRREESIVRDIIFII